MQRNLDSKIFRNATVLNYVPLRLLTTSFNSYSELLPNTVTVFRPNVSHYETLLHYSYTSRHDLSKECLCRGYSPISVCLHSSYICVNRVGRSPGVDQGERQNDHAHESSGTCSSCRWDRTNTHVTISNTGTESNARGSLKSLCMERSQRVSFTVRELTQSLAP